MAFGRDREYARASALPDWLKGFAEHELKREADSGSPFQDIKELFGLNRALSAVEEKVSEMKARMGLERASAEAGSPDGLVATASDRRGAAEFARELAALASRFEDEGDLEAAAAADRMLARMLRFAESVPEALKKHPNLKTFIDNVCRSRGGHVSVHSLMKMIRDERPENVPVTSELRKYIEAKLDEEKQEVSDGGDQVAGDGVGATVSRQEEQEANRMFEPPRRDY